MKVIDGLENIRQRLPYPVLTLGNFDGVHLGHKAIFGMLKDRAQKKNGTSIVFTFCTSSSKSNCSREITQTSYYV